MFFVEEDPYEERVGTLTEISEFRRSMTAQGAERTRVLHVGQADESGRRMKERNLNLRKDRGDDGCFLQCTSTLLAVFSDF